IGRCGVVIASGLSLGTGLVAAILALPASRSRSFLASGRRSGVLPVGAVADAAAVAGLGAAPGSGMVTLIGVTVPREESGLSRSFSLPTTSSAIWSGCTYCLATRDTSSPVTLRMLAGYSS